MPPELDTTTASATDAPAEQPAMGSDAKQPTVDLAEFERTKEALKKANKEAETNRKRAKELEDAEAVRVAATQTDAQKAEADRKKLEDRATAAEQRLAAIERERVIGREARGLNIFEDSAIDDLPDRRELAEVDLADTKALRKALEDLGKAKPHLLKRSPAEGANTNAGSRNGQGAGLLMTDDQEAEYRRKYIPGAR